MLGLLARRDRVGDAVRDRTGLARACAGEDRDGTAERRRGLPLLLVEAREDAVGVGERAGRRR